MQSRMALEKRRCVCVCGEPALCFCHDCDVAYCESCRAKRHRKGALVRHQLAWIVVVTSTRDNNNSNSNNNNNSGSGSDHDDDDDLDDGQEGRGDNNNDDDRCDSNRGRQRRRSSRRHQQNDENDDNLNVARNQVEEQLLLPMCDECMERKAMLVCRGCELNLCADCSKEVHRFGSLQRHMERNQFEFFTASSATASHSRKPRASSMSTLTFTNQMDQPEQEAIKLDRRGLELNLNNAERPQVARHARFGILEDNQQQQQQQASQYFKPIVDDDQLGAKRKSPRRKFSESDAYDLWSHWNARAFIQRSASLDEWPSESVSPSKDLAILSSINKSLENVHVTSPSNNEEAPARTSDVQPELLPSSSSVSTSSAKSSLLQNQCENDDGERHNIPAFPTSASSSAFNPGDMDDLFNQLATDFASRHLILRNRDRHKQLDGSSIQRHLQSFGEVAVFRDEFVKEGLVFVTYFELKSAVCAMKSYTSSLRHGSSRRSGSAEMSDTSRAKKDLREPDILTRFCAPFEFPSALNSGSLVVKIHGRAISSEEMRTFCSRFGEVASVLQNDLYSSDYIVEYNDLRHLPKAMAALSNAEHSNGAILVSRPNPSALDLKRIQFFQDCLDSLAVLSPVLDDDAAETTGGSGNRSQSYSSMQTSPTSSSSSPMDGSFSFDSASAGNDRSGGGSASAGGSSSSSATSPFAGSVFSTVNTSPLLGSLGGSGASSSTQKIWSKPHPANESAAPPSRIVSSQERNAVSSTATESPTPYTFLESGNAPMMYENPYRGPFQPNNAAALYNSATYVANVATASVSHAHAQTHLVAHASNLHGHSSHLPPYHNQRALVAMSGSGQMPVRFPTYALRSTSDPSFRTSSPGMAGGATASGMHTSVMHLGGGHPGACVGGVHGSGSASLYHTNGGRNDQGIGEYSLSIERVCSGEDKRTTLMIRNIPNKYTQQMLLAEINQHHSGLYDFFYLPIDFKNKCNMGYAFINFVECESIVSFYQEFNNQKWTNFNSEKVCAISYARLQGKQAMITRFQNSSLLEKHESYRPLVFGSSGTNRGKPEPFPSPKQQLKKHSMATSFSHSSAATGFAGVEYSSSPIRPPSSSSAMLHGGAPMNMGVAVPPQHLHQHHPQLGQPPQQQQQQQQHLHVPTGPMPYNPSLHHGVYQENPSPHDSTSMSMTYPGGISQGYLY